MSTPPPSRTDQEPSLPVGTTLGRFVILDRVGVGGMSVVYSAYDPELDRKVAIKILKSDHWDATGRARALREAQAMAKLSHPHVVAVYEVGAMGDQLFVAMELVDGVTLREWQAAAPRAWHATLDVLVQAGRGLCAAHAAGLVHRDVKPANILVDKQGRARVTDFGIARPLHHDAGAVAERSDAHWITAQPSLDGTGDAMATITRAGAVIGTPAYMSPEQAKGTFDERSDQYSFCATAHEALFGTRAPDATARAVRVDAWVKNAIVRGLAEDPAQRHPSMEALLHALTTDPGARRKRLARVIGLGAGFAALAAVSLGLSARSERPAPVIAAAPVCAGGEEQLADVWPARADAIHQAFLATRLPYAGAAWTAVEHGLARYTTAWIASRREACEATRLRGEQSEEALDLRMGCLARRRNELRALVTVLEQADAEVVEHAAAAAAALTPVASCDDVAALKETPAPPAAAAALVDEVRVRLADVKALHHAGKYATALPLAQELVTRAQAIGYLPLHAEALLAVGDLQIELADFAGAAKSLDEAAWAAEASGEDRLNAAAQIATVEVVGAEQGAWVEARKLARRTDALLVHLGDPPELRGRLHRALGLVANREGDLVTGVKEGEQALALLERVHGPRDFAVAAARRFVGGSYSQLGDTAKARRYLEEALAVQEDLLGPDHPAVAGTLLALSIVAGDALKYRDALRYAERSLSIRERALGPRHPLVATTLTTLGAARLWLGDKAGARRDYERALDIYEHTPGAEYMAAGPLDNLGELELDEHHYAEAKALFERALALDEQALGPEHPDLAFSLSGLGEAWLGLGKPARAVPLLERALALISGEPRATAEIQFALARARWQLGRDRKGARALAVTARAFFAAAPDAHREDLGKIDAWLASH